MLMLMMMMLIAECGQIPILLDALLGKNGVQTSPKNFVTNMRDLNAQVALAGLVLFNILVFYS